jgi:hypothetical protein
MSADPHDFRKSLKDGKQGEEELDRHFGRWYLIEEVPISDEKRYGIDRIFECKQRGVSFGVEYKTDSEAAVTGNAFIEVVSDDTRGTPGWAKKSIAMELIYYIRPEGKIYIFQMHHIKRALSKWIARYPQRPALNKGYNTIGVLVPLNVLCRLPHIELNISA